MDLIIAFIYGWMRKNGIGLIIVPTPLLIANFASMVSDKK